MPTSRAVRALVLPLLALAGAAAAAQPFQSAGRDLAAARAAGGGTAVRPGIYRLAGSDPDSPASDLEPLRRRIGTASVVGLGGSLYTSGGFQRMQDRTFRYLVERAGFRALAIESPWIPAQRAAQFVDSCDGTADLAAAALLDVWRSAEVRDLLQWMCDWNHGHPKAKDRVHLFGFDVQDTQAQAHLAAADLLAFLGRIGIVIPEPRAAGLLKCAGADDTVPTPMPFPDSLHQACSASLDALDQLFLDPADAAEITRQTSAADFAAARLDLRSLRAWEDSAYFLGRDSQLSFEARDRGMADVFLALKGLLDPKVRAVVWAGNAHIARNWDAATGAVSMGTLIGRKLGRNYLPIALAGYDIGVDGGPREPALCGVKAFHGEDSIEARLHDLGQPVLFADLKFPGGRPPFLAPGATYQVGDDLVVPLVHYDALIFLDQAPAMSPLGRNPCTPR